MQKVLILATLIGLAQVSFAQDENLTWQEQMQSVFENVDLNQVPTGILSEYSLDFLPLENYQGSLDENNLILPNNIRLLYASLYSGRVNENFLLRLDSLDFAPTVLSPRGLADRFRLYERDGLTELSILAYHYNKMKARAFFAREDNKIYPNPKFEGNPYAQHTCFAAGASQARFNKATITFVLRRRLFLSNFGELPISMEINLADRQGFRALNFDAPIIANYTEEGEKTIQLRITYEDGHILESHFLIYTTGNTEGDNQNVFPGVADEEFLIQANRSYLGKTARGAVSIAYSDSTKELDKPLIMVEGFDPWKIISPDEPSTNFSYLDFIAGEDEKRRLSLNTQEDLRKLGYDLIFLDLEEGTDYVQRNAFLVQKLLRVVDSLQVGDEPRVIMGLSMGGLLVRYALRDMELRQEPHKVRLFVSMDTPHQGAYIPLSTIVGLQHIGGYGLSLGNSVVSGQIVQFRDLNSDIDRGLRLLSEPATRQLLIEFAQGRGGRSPRDFFAFRDNSFYSAFQQELAELGYPQGDTGLQIRNIAISNGSECGRSNKLGSSEEIARFDGTCKLGDLLGGNIPGGFASLIWPYVSPAIQNFWDVPLVTFASIWPFSQHRFKPKFTFRSMPDSEKSGANNTIYEGQLIVEKKIFFFIKIRQRLLDYRHRVGDWALPWGGSPGGLAIPSDFDIDIDNLDLLECIAPTNNLKEFGFVPLRSALDISGDTLNPSILKRGISNAEPLPLGLSSPFDNFISAPGNNESHTEFTGLNSQWLLDEIQGRPSNVVCLPFCEESIEVEGPEIICNGDTVQFRIINLPTDNRFWDSSNRELLKIQSISGRAFAEPEGKGSIRIRLRTNTRCLANGRAEYNKFIWIGEPEKVTNRPIEKRNFGSCFEPNYAYRFARFSGATNYKLNVTSNDPAFAELWVEIDLDGLGFSISSLPLSQGREIPFKVTITASNECGLDILEFEDIYIQKSLCKCSPKQAGCRPPQDCFRCLDNPLIQVYPNPATNRIQIILTEVNSLNQLRIFSLYDHQGNKVWELETRESMLNLDISKLEPGLYQLMVQGKEMMTEERILIK